MKIGQKTIEFSPLDIIDISTGEPSSLAEQRDEWCPDLDDTTKVISPREPLYINHLLNLRKQREKLIERKPQTKKSIVSKKKPRKVSKKLESVVSSKVPIASQQMVLDILKNL